MRSTWYSIDDMEHRKQKTIPDSVRGYMCETNDRKERNNCSLVYGSRKKLPYFKDCIVNHVNWFKFNHCNTIASFFEAMERKLATIRFECTDKDNNSFVANNISRLMTNSEVGCKDYVFSGQCIVANFGFMQEEKMHMNNDPRNSA